MDYDKAPYERRDGSFRTQFWRVFDHHGLIYADCDSNMRYAMRRQTALKQPQKWFLMLVGESVHDHHVRYNDWLATNQVNDYKSATAFRNYLRALYAPYFAEYTTSEIEALDHAGDPHKKRLPRLQAIDDLAAGSRVDYAERTWVFQAELKVKKDETAKWSKYPRTIVDLGCPASLRGSRLAGFMKDAQAYEEIHWRGCIAVFIKTPNHALLQEAFEKLLDPPGRGYFIFFSDDSCFSVRVHGVVHIYNVDISSCDASHGPRIFSGLADLIPERIKDDFSILVEQCMVPLNIISRHNRKNKVRIKPSRPVLYSGSTITTIINNFANTCIFRRLAETDFLPDTVEEQLIQGAAAAGYAITLDYCHDYPDIQFLKHSPVYDTSGVLHPLLNFGVLLRASGNCRGDLPGRGPTMERARMFQSALLQGIYPNVSAPIIDQMKAECAGTAATSAVLRHVETQFLHKVNAIAPTMVRLTDNELLRRYRVTAFEHAAFQQDLDLAPGHLHVSNAVSNKVLQLDYGLPAAGYSLN